MRVGVNPKKVDARLGAYADHRIIIPVYIPEVTDYYEKTAEILKMHLESLCRSVEDRAKITVVSNGCADEVNQLLTEYYDSGRIDQLLLNRENRGKVDAIVSVARGAFEELITFSDCDVLFMPGWLEAVEQIFHDFPECGAAAPVPRPDLLWYDTSATLIGAVAKRMLGFGKVVSDDDLDAVERSIGAHFSIAPQYRQAQAHVRRRGTTACIGCGHFVITIRRDAVTWMPPYPSLKAVAQDTETIWIDDPPERLGLWRLATTRVLAHHMGNVLEDWARAEFERAMTAEASSTANDSDLPGIRRSRLPWKLRSLATRALRKLNGEALLRKLYG
jgi:cellulose synthase/poly-beta-1,6-N-acetylglucosamine synthase-like glycosyltransferase